MTVCAMKVDAGSTCLTCALGTRATVCDSSPLVIAVRLPVVYQYQGAYSSLNLETFGPSALSFIQVR